MGAWYVELPGCTKYVVMKRGIRSDRVSFHVDHGTDPDAESVSDDADDAGGDDDDDGDDGDDGDDDNNGGDGGNAGAADGDGDVVIAAGHAGDNGGGNLGNAAAQGRVQGPPPPPDVPFAVWAFHVQQMLQAPSSASTAVPEASRSHDVYIYIYSATHTKPPTVRQHIFYIFNTRPLFCVLRMSL